MNARNTKVAGRRAGSSHGAALLVAAVLIAAAGAPCSAQLYVDASFTGTGAGTLAAPYTSLQEALTDARAGGVSQILVAEGTYTPGGTRPTAFEMVAGVSIIGGYAAVTFAGPDPDLYVTVLSGERGNPALLSDNHLAVVLCNISGSATVEGVTIERGYTLSTTTGGAGVRHTGGTLYLEDCLVTDNHTRTAGGAIEVNGDANLFMTQVTVSENISLNGAGGIALLNGAYAMIDQCSFEENRSLEGRGGGMYAYDAVFDAYSTVFRANYAYSSGGGLYLYNSATGEIRNCTFAYNDADANRGGAVFSAATVSTALYMYNSIYWSNTSGESNSVYGQLAGPMRVRTSDIDNLSTMDSSVVDTLCTDGDPTFYSTTDLRLQAGSPCLDAGNNSYVVGFDPRDRDGLERIMPSAIVSFFPVTLAPDVVDMGAYERRWINYP